MASQRGSRGQICVCVFCLLPASMGCWLFSQLLWREEVDLDYSRVWLPGTGSFLGSSRLCWVPELELIPCWQIAKNKAFSFCQTPLEPGPISSCHFTLFSCLRVGKSHSWLIREIWSSVFVSTLKPFSWKYCRNIICNDSNTSCLSKELSALMGFSSWPLFQNPHSS